MSDSHINFSYCEEDAADVADILDLDACSALGRTAEELWSKSSEPGPASDLSPP